MNNGVVVEVKSKYSIVLSGGMFLRIVNKGQMETGMPVLFTDDDIYHEVVSIKPIAEKRQINWRMMASIAAVFVLAVIGLTYMRQPVPTTYALVDVSINPSVEFALGERGQVIGLEALNEDGQTVMDFDYKDKPLDQALLNYVDVVENKGFLQGVNAPKITLTYIEKLPLKQPVDFSAIQKELEDKGFEVVLIFDDEQTSEAPTTTRSAKQTETSSEAQSNAPPVEITTEPTATDVPTTEAMSQTEAQVIAQAPTQSSAQTTKVTTTKTATTSAAPTTTEVVTMTEAEATEVMTEATAESEQETTTEARTQARTESRIESPTTTEPPTQTTAPSPGEDLIVISTPGGVIIEIPIPDLP